MSRCYGLRVLRVFVIVITHCCTFVGRTDEDVYHHSFFYELNEPTAIKIALRKQGSITTRSETQSETRSGTLSETLKEIRIAKRK